MLVVCASLSGAPGVSTLALGLAACWPQPGGLLVEADPSGGVVAARFGLAQQPGLASLAASARHGGLGVGAVGHVQRLPLGVDVVVGPGSAEAAAGAVAVLAGLDETAWSGLAPVAVVDAGRLYLGSPAAGLLPAADVVVLAATPDVECFDHVDSRLASLREQVRPGRLGLVLAGKSAFPVEEVAQRLAVPVWAQLPRDRWGAAVLSGRMTGRGWVRTRLAQAVRELAATLAREVLPVDGQPVQVRR